MQKNVCSGPHVSLDHYTVPEAQKLTPEQGESI